MANYNVTTKILIINIQDTSADNVTGSAAKAITDYLESVDAAKTIRSITVAPISNTRAAIIIIHDS